MARKYNDRYVRYYTFGSTAAKLDHVERKASLPEPKTPEKRKPIPFDPFAFAGNAVVIFLAILMIVGLFQVAGISRQVEQMQTTVTALEMERDLLQERYESGYDLEEVRAAAESMGMIPEEEAIHVRVQTPAERMEVQQLSWWDSLLLGLRQIFA